LVMQWLWADCFTASLMLEPMATKFFVLHLMNRTEAGGLKHSLQDSDAGFTICYLIISVTTNHSEILTEIPEQIMMVGK